MAAQLNLRLRIPAEEPTTAEGKDSSHLTPSLSAGNLSSDQDIQSSKRTSALATPPSADTGSLEDFARYNRSWDWQRPPRRHRRPVQSCAEPRRLRTSSVVPSR
jgi:hypothetical protein